MNRIEEIKERAKRQEYVSKGVGFDEAQEDIEWLLAKLEIAEAALKEVSPKLWDLVHEDGYTLIWDDVEKLVHEHVTVALQQLRS